MARGIDSVMQNTWYGDSSLRLALLPFSWLYAAIIAVRRYLYKLGVFSSHKLPVPVIVVGNITAGGTGKTPLTLWLAQQLAERSFNPGIVSRGYGGKVGPEPLEVTADSDPAVAGDEAVLMAGRSTCPVVVHPDRVAAARHAIELGAEIIVSDDGLQHYRLERDFEIAVVDADREYGNRHLLPAGPLREPLSRLNSIDQVLVQCETDDSPELTHRVSDSPPKNFRLDISAVCRLDNSDIRNSASFAGRQVHALAGIGNPDRFFRLLEANKIRVIPHPLPDHARISQEDLDFDDDLEVVMTEKDAVKCRWLDTTKCWYVPVDVVIDAADAEYLLNRILRKLGPKKADQL